MTIKNIGIAIILVLAPVSYANASLVQVNFSGTINTTGSFLDPSGLFAPGDAVSGFWLVETTTADAHVQIGRGIYPQTGAPAFQINIGSSVFQSDTANIQILNDFTLGLGTADAYDVLGGSATSNVADLSSIVIHILMRNFSPNLGLYSSEALPPGPPSPSDFERINGEVSGMINGELLFMTFGVDDISVVPVPAAAWLFVTALLGLLGLNGRRKLMKR